MAMATPTTIEKATRPKMLVVSVISMSKFQVCLSSGSILAPVLDFWTLSGH